MQSIGVDFVNALAGHNPHLPGVGSEDANHEILTNAMRPENAEGIRVSAGEKRMHLVDRQTEDFEVTHAKKSA